MQNNAPNNLFTGWDDAAIALIGIAFGIIAKFLYEYTIKYLQAKNKTKVRFDWKGFGSLWYFKNSLNTIVTYSCISFWDKIHRRVSR
jgi:O-antigen/teichoic acid export membrane protein